VTMRVAAYQAPLLPCGSMEAVELIRRRVDRCEAEGVDILCCPEAALGGLADDAAHPADLAIDVEGGQLEAILKPLASRMVTMIVGFTEMTATGHLYNAAAVFHRGTVVGLYRKLHPAIRKSVYRAGDRLPVFAVGDLTFGIVICNDSNYPDLARAIASRGAAAMFVPTNNGLPPEKADVIAEARADIGRAKDNRLWVIRADVAGRTPDRVSYGSSCIVDPEGTVLQAAPPFTEDLLIAEIDTAPRGRQRGPAEAGVAPDRVGM
jgi:predicted amidohydrolase